MNLKIKYRESFRPFAPAVLAEHASEYFELEQESPYMLLVAPVQEGRRLEVKKETGEGEDMLAIINQSRSDIPAVTHVDCSARIQTVGSSANPEFRRLLEAFHELTGCAVLVNTSFNVRGEPIVCTPDDAYRCFMRTDMDLLVLEDHLLWKSQQQAQPHDDRWKDEYELD
jgi:carbamoyltransferase